MLAAGTHEEVDVRRGTARVVAPSDHLGHRFPRDLALCEACHGDDALDRVACTVVEGDAQQQPSPAGGGRFGRLDRVQQLARDPVAAPDEDEPHARRDAALLFGEDRAAEEAHQRHDLAPRARPVVGRERVERHRPDAMMARDLDHLARLACADHVTRGTRTTARAGPAAIAVHDDRQMQAGWCDRRGIGHRQSGRKPDRAKRRGDRRVSERAWLRSAPPCG